jgi:hypothetical protein
VREATVEEVAAVPGFGTALARTVLTSLGVPVPALSSDRAAATPSPSPEP